MRVGCRYNFIVRQKEVEQLKIVTLEQIKAFYVANIPRTAKGRHRLAVHVVSSTHQDEAVQESVDDLDKLKSSLTTCPLPPSSLLS